jgi:hypothetical protein
MQEQNPQDRVEHSQSGPMDINSGRTLDRYSDFANLAEYIQKRLFRVIEDQELDPALRSGITFHGIDIRTLAAVPRNDSEEFAHIIGGTEIHSGTVSVERTLQFGEEIEMGTVTFCNVAEMIEETITTSPRTALEYVLEQMGPLPDHVETLPSVNKIKDLQLTKYKNYGTPEIRRYHFPDFRIVSLEKALKRAASVHNTLTKNSQDPRYDRFGVYCPPSNPWEIRLYKLRLDYVGQMIMMIKEQPLPENVTILQPSTGKPKGYIHNNEDDLLITKEPFSEGLPSSSIAELESRLDMLLEEHEKIQLRVRTLRFASDATDKIVDGAIIEFLLKEKN